MDKIKAFWESTKAWFKYSWTILLARITALAGILVAAVSAIDWSPLFSTTGMTKTQLVWMATGLLVQGVSFEVARRQTLSA